jgi:aspartyl protease family protein
MTALTGDQIASLVYLSLLTAVIGGWFVVSQRRQAGRLAQYAAIWGFIFLGAIVAVGLWGDIRETVAPRQSVMMEGARVELPRAVDGHFYVTMEVNGAPIRFVIDTGASELVLSRADAARAGIEPDGLIFSGRAFTANGMVETAPVTLASVVLGGVADTDVPAVVNAGEMPESLLGMSYLERFSRMEIANGRMVLER